MSRVRLVVSPPSTMSAERIAVVTGANRGIGLAVVKKLCRSFEGRVFLTSRSSYRGGCAVKTLNRKGFFPCFHQLDVSNRGSRERFAAYLNLTYGGVDVLVNNAGIRHLADSRASYYEQAKETLSVNYFGTAFVCRVLLALLRPNARIVNLSSGSAFLTEIPNANIRNTFLVDTLNYADLQRIAHRYHDAVKIGAHLPRGWGRDPYVVSYILVAAFTAVLQRNLTAERPGDGILVNCYYPGGVTTLMTRYRGNLTSDESAGNIAVLAMLPPDADGPAGQYVWPDMSVRDWRGGQRPGRPAAHGNGTTAGNTTADATADRPVGNGTTAENTTVDATTVVGDNGRPAGNGTTADATADVGDNATHLNDTTEDRSQTSEAL